MSRYSTRSKVKVKSEQSDKSHVNPILFEYSSNGEINTAKGVITFTKYDLGQMRSPMYLNDTVISFFMQYHLDKNVDQKTKDKIHVFNNFFYSKIKPLKGNQDGEDISLKCASRWLKGVGIFDKDFLIMPICENGHWFLVIICYPWRESQGRKYVLMEDESLHEPAVFVLNSSRHTFAPKVKKSLGKFLRYQWKIERGSERAFAIHNAKKHGIRLSFPDVPQQRNNYNCGVYILNYFYCFLRDPRQAYLKMMRGRDLKKWFDEHGINIGRERARMNEIVSTQAKHWQDRKGPETRVKQDSQDIHIDSVSNSSSSSIDVTEANSNNPVIVIH